MATPFTKFPLFHFAIFFVSPWIFGDEIEVWFDGAEPHSHLGDVAWGLAEKPDGGFFIVGEHLLDKKVDSYNRKALLIVTDPKGKPVSRIELPGYMHAAKIRSCKDGTFVISGNKRKHGASILFVDSDGKIVREKANITEQNSRPNTAVDAFPTRDGGFLVGCKEGLYGFLTKLDSELKLEWTTAAIEHLNYIKSTTRSANGDCFLVGQYQGGKGVFISRWNKDGKFIDKAIHTIDKRTNKGRRILINQKDQLVITGMVGSGGNGHFLFMIVKPDDIHRPLVTKRVDLGDGVGACYGQALIQCRDGSYVIAGRSGKGKTHLLSMVRVNQTGDIIAGPKFFGRGHSDFGDAGYDVVECRDGSIAAVGIKETELLEPSDITDIRPNADFYLIKTRLDPDQ